MTVESREQRHIRLNAEGKCPGCGEPFHGGARQATFGDFLVCADDKACFEAYDRNHATPTPDIEED